MRVTGAVAAVDCGTNSTRLLVVGPSGDVKAREMRITRLGEGVDATRTLRPEAMERTFAALREYRSIMDGGGRRAGPPGRHLGGPGRRERRSVSRPGAEIVGTRAELLSGGEEGRLSYAGATADLPFAEGPVIVLDIGGGSTEIVTKAEDEVLSVSLDIGCVRLTERFLRSDPPTADEVSAAASAIGRELDRAAREIPLLVDAGGSARLIGLAGTVSTLASLELGLSHYDRDRIHHAVLSRQAVGRWCEVLGAERIADRARRPGLPAGRQDVILGGALVLHEVMCRFDLHECIVSEADILDGLVLSLRISPGSGSPAPGRVV